MDELDRYLQIVIGKDAGIIFLCVFGAILNSVMLYLLLSKKQTRSSVHTIYMVQIAITDLLVCVVWMVLTSVTTHNLLQIMKEPPITDLNGDGIPDSNGSSAYAAVVADEEASPAQYRSWRIMYYWYNFHYYTNILLLASMSVERCAAVWKSMRCQRYQYNRKVIIGVSVLMWFIAFAFVLPDLINPDLMVTDSDSAGSVSKTFLPVEDEVPTVSPEEWKNKQANALFEVFQKRNPTDESLPQSVAIKVEPRTYENEEINYKKDLDSLYVCYTLMMKSMENEDDFVRDDGRVTVDGCINNVIMAILTQYAQPQTDETQGDGTDDPTLEYSSDYFDFLPLDDSNDTGGLSDLDDEILDEFLNDDILDEDFLDDDLLLQFEIRNKTTDALIAMNRGMYQTLLADAVKLLVDHHHNVRIGKSRGCDPHISDAARIYVLVVNLVLGFFVPFSIIVFSYVSIAYMIGKRARSRMHPDMSETSTTRFAHNYIQNHSTTNVPLGPINMRDRRQSRARRDSVSRRMSDFMRSVIFRRPQAGAENRSYLTDSDREVTPYGSRQNVPYSSSSKPYEESSGQHAKSDNAIQYRPAPKSSEEEKSSEEDPLYDPELQEAIRQLSAVRMRNDGREDLTAKVNPRIKKYSFGDAANDNIPQTIEEHPHEIEADEDDERYLTASSGSCQNDSATPSMRNHAALLMVQRNSRRESGGSYGSSMDSMATDQTSVMNSLHDKRHSAATTVSALTPPTPIEPNNPNSNQFFPNNDDKTPYYRSQSVEAGYPLLGDSADQRQRLLKPGSQLNDITLKLYRNSLQKKQIEDDLPQLKEDDNVMDSSSDRLVPGTSASNYRPLKTQRYSYPHIPRSKSAPDNKLESAKPSSKSTTRLVNEHQRTSNDGEPRQTVSHYPKYHRQNSSASTVFFTRGRTYSTTSRGSVTGQSTLRKTMARKNAERHLRVSRTVLTYVIVFSICWLPQRITYLLFVIEALTAASTEVCARLISGVRVLSFISVLLNPAVYILTRRDFKTYVRNSAWGSRLRRWYAKCTQRRVLREESNLDSRGRPGSSHRNGEVEMQVRNRVPEPEDPELSGNNRPASRPPYRMSSPPRSTSHVRKSPVGGPQEMFAPQNGINVRRHDATIDEMKEEEAAAEESFEKEKKRLAAEQERRRKDDINRNFLESSEDDILSAKTNGSGNKTTSSSSKSESFEQFWMRFLQSGGADILTPANGDLTSPEAPNGLQSGFPDLEQLGRNKPGTNNANNVLNEPGVLE